MWSLCGACSAHVASCCLDAIQRSVSPMARLFLYHTCIIFVPSFPGQSGHIWYCKQSFASCHDLVRLDAVRKRFDKGSGKMMGIWWEEVFKLLPCHFNVPIMSHNAPHLNPFIFHYSPSPMFILVYLCSYSDHILFSLAHPLISLWYHFCITLVNFAEVFKMQCCEDAVTRCMRIDLELWGLSNLQGNCLHLQRAACNFLRSH